MAGSDRRPREGRAALRVLVVEDEPSIRDGLCDVLAYHGFAPLGVETGEEALRERGAAPWDLVLLDLMLPGIDGFEVCEALRAEDPRLPILMLTARGAEADVLRGFRCGADDYVTKPFSIAELVARVEALLRRAGRLAAEEAAPFEAGPLRVDPAAQVAELDGRTLELTRREVEMLALLARESGRIVSRRALLQEVWGFPRPDRIETRTVDMHVAKLRRKLGAGRDLIETVRGEGYRFRA
jgi:two-component system response regulator RegX3